VTDWVIDVVDAAGYIGLIALMVLECVFPPIPSEAILPFVGFAVDQGDLNFALALGAATLGSVIGNAMLYVVFRRGGRPLVARHGARVGATPERLERLEDWMGRYGSATVLIARAVPLARSAVSVPAGLARFPFWRFIVLTAIGSAIWNGALIGAGWALGDAWQRVEERVSGATIGVLVAAVVVCAVWYLIARRRRRARREPAAGS
jgi:membrane protein DedA with SNARE-associated domain